MKTKTNPTNPAANIVQGFYTVAEAAAITKRSSQTIVRDIKAGKLAALQPGGPNTSRLIPQGNLVSYLYGTPLGSQRRGKK
ncbi:MAG: hypothetical protein QOI07_152 [Verrucomicrobiota bacterium]|jgi:excisionase family DNA binding protein